MQSKKLSFEGAYGDTLSGRLDFPDEHEPEAYVLFAHCFTCSKNLKSIDNISRALTDENFAIFRFDFTGLGESEGDFSDTNISSNIDDLVQAAKYMETEYQAPDILLGHSLGGAAVLQAAHKIPHAKAVATIAAPANPEHVKENFAGKLDKIEEEGKAEVTLEGRSFTIKKQFLDDLEELNMNKRVETLDKALLILHSPIDNQVGIENAGHIFDHARHPKSFISLDEADHLLTEEKYSRYAGTILATWAYMYINNNE